MFNQLWSHGPLYACMCWTAGGWALIHALMCAYTCMDGCLLAHVDRCLYMRGRVLIHAWMSAYTCVDGCLCMHGRVLVHEWTGACLLMHERVFVHAWTGVLYAWTGTWMYYNE